MTLKVLSFGEDLGEAQIKILTFLGFGVCFTDFYNR